MDGKLLFLIVGLAIGLIFGIIIKTIYGTRYKVYGTVDIDPVTGLCRFRISSDEIANPQKSYAYFRINHNAEISRDEQGL